MDGTEETKPIPVIPEAPPPSREDLELPPKKHVGRPTKYEKLSEKREKLKNSVIDRKMIEKMVGQYFDEPEVQATFQRFGLTKTYFARKTKALMEHGTEATQLDLLKTLLKPLLKTGPGKVTETRNVTLFMELKKEQLKDILSGKKLYLDGGSGERPEEEDGPGNTTTGEST